MFYTPQVFSPFPHIIAAQSTRLGGYSQPPYDQLNLGLHTEDDRQIVKQNRALFFQALDFKSEEVAFSHQMHGTDVFWDATAGSVQGYDAFVTQKAGVLLSISIADCTPVLLYDELRQVVAAVHVGWRGTAGQLVRKVLEGMAHRYGSLSKGIYAYIGACICEKTFEVDADVADQFEPVFKKWDSRRGKYLIDLKSANKTQLLQFGVPDRHIEVSSDSTFLQYDQYFSYRKKKGVTGRMLAVIGKKRAKQFR